MPPDRLRVNTVLGRHIEQRQETRDHLKLAPEEFWICKMLEDWKSRHKALDAPVPRTVLGRWRLLWTRWWTRSPVVSDWRCFSAPIGVTMLRSGAKPSPVALLVS